MKPELVFRLAIGNAALEYEGPLDDVVALLTKLSETFDRAPVIADEVSVTIQTRQAPQTTDGLLFALQG